MSVPYTDPKSLKELAKNAYLSQPSETMSAICTSISGRRQRMSYYSRVAFSDLRPITFLTSYLLRAKMEPTRCGHCGSFRELYSASAASQLFTLPLDADPVQSSRELLGGRGWLFRGSRRRRQQGLSGLDATETEKRLHSCF